MLIQIYHKGKFVLRGGSLDITYKDKKIKNICMDAKAADRTYGNSGLSLVGIWIGGSKMVRSRSIIATSPGATIKEQLNDRGMSQKEFAVRIDMS